MDRNKAIGIIETWADELFKEQYVPGKFLVAIDTLKPQQQTPCSDDEQAACSGYETWLEKRLLEHNPRELCYVVEKDAPDYCRECCVIMRPECLRKRYEIYRRETEK